MVTIAIISIMAVSMWVGYGNWRSRSTLNTAAQKVAADIRKVQNWAVSTSQIEDPGSGSMIIPCGYGIHYIDSDTYILFANIQKVGGSNNCSDSNRVYETTTPDIAVETVNIEQRNISFQGSFDDILFFPPDPLTLITESSPLDTGSKILDGILPGYTSAIITLCFSGSLPCKAIEVRGTGLVDIQ